LRTENGGRASLILRAVTVCTALNGAPIDHHATRARQRQYRRQHKSQGWFHRHVSSRSRVHNACVGVGIGGWGAFFSSDACDSKALCFRRLQAWPVTFGPTFGASKCEAAALSHVPTAGGFQQSGMSRGLGVFLDFTFESKGMVSAIRCLGIAIASELLHPNILDERIADSR
jgi:hypothetical protein